MKRNEEATCATCPYWAPYDRCEEQIERSDHDMGVCRFAARSEWPDMFSDTVATHWCGRHPDFFEKLEPEITGGPREPAMSQALIDKLGWSGALRPLEDN